MIKAAKPDNQPPLSLQEIAEQKTPDESDAEVWNLRLYVAGQTPRSIETNLRLSSSLFSFYFSWVWVFYEMLPREALQR